MSDKPQGPGWWLASDGTWHPPELHPSVQAEPVDVSGTTYAPDVAAARAMHPSAVPEMTDVPEMACATGCRGGPGMHPVPSRASPEAHLERRVRPAPRSRPMYPDLFERAIAGTHLADVVTVSSPTASRARSLDVASFTGRPGDDRRAGAHVGPDSGRGRRLHGGLGQAALEAHR